MAKSDSIRAVRNNNPGNIERGAKWQGLTPLAEMSDEQRDEKRFAVFKSPKWGFRALLRTLITYQDKYDVNAIGSTINRWAPPSENDTRAYVRHVCELSGRSADEPLNYHEWKDARPVVKAIATHECGGWFFDEKDLDAGLRLAGVEKPPEALAKSRTVQAAAIGGTATGLGFVAEIAGQITPAASIAREVADYAPTAAAVIVLVVLAAVIWYRYDDWRRAAR